MSLGERVRALRQARGMTLAALASDQVSVALISKIERGLVSPSLNTLYQLAARLEVAPARLLEEGDPGNPEAEAARALAVSRAYLLLGDPATAGRRAATAAQTAGATGLTRARLLAVCAEAQFASGHAAEASERVLVASQLLVGEGTRPSAGNGTGAAGDGERAAATAEVTWALGLLERRRGNRPAAQRSWTRCLDALEGCGAGEPALELLGARVQVELAALHEVDGALETAKQFLIRASATLARLSEPASAALAVLEQDEGAAPVALGAHDGAATSALALAVVAAAGRLAPQTDRDLARLERLASRWAVAVAPAEVSHSRHLR